VTWRALLYLMWMSVWNRLSSRVRRSREPRYLLALVAGGLYIWFFLFHNIGEATRQGQGPGAPFLSQGARLIVIVLLILGSLSAWVFGEDRSALAFSAPEVSLLFPAPLSRRDLVGYKLLRAQIAILFNVVIWVVLLRRGGAELPPLMRAVGIWILFTTTHLHRLSAALVRSSIGAHGRGAWRRHRMSLALFALIVIGATAAVVSAIHAVGGVHDMHALVAAATAALHSGVGAIVLWPFVAVTGPLYAHTVGQALVALPGALVVVGVHAVWVLGADSAFEDAAVAASAARAQRLAALRKGRFGRVTEKPVRVKASAGGLSPVGHPAIAVLWKNFLCLKRTVQTRTLIAPVLGAVALAALTSSDIGGPARAVAMGCSICAGILVIFGPMIARNDLRQDMLHLVALKTLPLRGATVVAAEVASSAIPVALAQWVLLVVAGVALSFAPLPKFGPSAMVVTVLVALPALLVFNVLFALIRNGAPILFPSWVKLGAMVGGGVEMLGQNLVSFGFIAVLLALMLVLPVGIGGGAIFLLRGLPAIGLLVGLVTATAILAGEVAGAVEVLGRALERTEPGQVPG
jgi:hypothetical protein